MPQLTALSAGRWLSVVCVAAATAGLLVGCGANAAATPARSAATAAVRAPGPPSGVPVRVRRRIVGNAVSGAPIIAYVVGDPAARRRVLLVGCVHGDERQGEVITRRLRTGTPPTGTVWWLIDQANPDGCRAGRRQNGHGVDLNRNSPWHWRRLDAPGGVHYAGPRPLSEPESRAVNRLVRRLRPTVSVWYHQHAALVDTSSGGQIALERHYAAESGLPLQSYGRVPGSITTWQDTRLASSTAFVVELPAGRLSPAAIVRHLKAVRSLSPTRRSALRDPSSAGGQTGSSRIRSRSRR